MKNKKVHENLKKKTKLCTYFRLIIKFVWFVVQAHNFRKGYSWKKSTWRRTGLKMSEKNVVCEKDVLCLLYKANEPNHQTDRIFILH